MIGKTFNRLTVIDQLPERDKYGYILFSCRCRCGNLTVTSGSDLRGNRVKSCGCIMGQHLIRENAARKHFMYGAYRAMKQRCYNPNNSGYKWYGKQGITVCDRWMKSFWSFVEDMGERPKGYSLDRRDNLLGYSKENCKWSTPKEQTQNRRINIVK